MVPADYSNFFATMATVSATLFGLIFLVISITPESIAAETAPLERQIKAVAAYFALVNPLILSLFALLPHQEIGPAVIALGSSGLFNMIVMALLLFRDSAERAFLFRNGLFILAGLALYGLEVYSGLQLLHSSDSVWIYALGSLLIFILIFGVARAWELVGMRHFHLRDWLANLGTRTSVEKKDKKQKRKK